MLNTEENISYDEARKTEFDVKMKKSNFLVQRQNDFSY